MDNMVATDTVLWTATLARARRELAELPAAERDWFMARVASIGELQRQLDELFRQIGGPQVCRGCLGGCCGLARHHATLTNLLGYLLREQEPPVPDFSLTCPFLGVQGCRLPVEHRPLNCIIFLCETLDERLTELQRKNFIRIEGELRQVYHDVAGRCPGAGLSGLLIAAARVGERPLLTAAG